MTNIGKENIIKRIQNSGLFNDFEGAEEYIISLIKRDIKYSSEKYITLREAIEKYGFGTFKAEMGAGAIKKLLEEIDLDKLSEKLKKEIKYLKFQI